MPNVAVMGMASVALVRDCPLSRLLSRWISRLFHHGCCVLGARGFVTLTLSANGGVERDPWTWGWKLPFLPFPFSFFTAAAFLALGGTWPWPWVRTAASSVTRELNGESSLSSLSRSLSSRLLRSRRSGVRDLDLECERRRRRSVSSVTRELDGESSLSSLSRSLSSRLLRSRRSG